MMIYTDNNSVLQAVMNSDVRCGETMIHAPAHVALALEKVADEVACERLLVGKVGTGENMSDIGTKSLSGYKTMVFGGLLLNDMYGVFGRWGPQKGVLKREDQGELLKAWGIDKKIQQEEKRQYFQSPSLRSTKEKKFSLDADPAYRVKMGSVTGEQGGVLTEAVPTV